MMTRFLPLSLTLALFAAISPLFAKDAMPLVIYGVSIGEEKAVVVKFHEKDGEPILEVAQSEPLGAGVPVELLVEAVLWPQRQLKEGYIMTSITTKDGKVISGYIDSEDKSRVIIRDAATGKTEMIPVRKVEARQDAGTLMPPGLTASLSRAELRDLIRFLSDQKGQEINP
jgi:putative heme-binding domain-containing protein